MIESLVPSSFDRYAAPVPREPNQPESNQEEEDEEEDDRKKEDDDTDDGEGYSE